MLMAVGSASHPMGQGAAQLQRSGYLVMSCQEIIMIKGKFILVVQDDPTT